MAKCAGGQTQLSPIECHGRLNQISIPIRAVEHIFDLKIVGSNSIMSNFESYPYDPNISTANISVLKVSGISMTKSKTKYSLFCQSCLNDYILKLESLCKSPSD